KELEPPQTIPNPTRIGQGFPLILPPPDRLPSSFTGPAPAPRLIAPDTGVFDQKLKLPTVHEWNLNIQRQLPFGVVAQVGYVGKRGLRLLRAYDLNQIKTDHDGLLPSFLLAQQNLRRGCNPTGSRPSNATPDQCVGGGVPIGILETLFGTASMNSSTTV